MPERPLMVNGEQQERGPDSPGVAVKGREVETGTADTAVTLLRRVLPILDLSIAEHRDGARLQRDILYFLAGQGYPGHLTTRRAEWGG